MKHHLPDITHCITNGYFDPRKVVRPLRVLASFPLIEDKRPVVIVSPAVRNIVKRYTDQ